MIALTEDRRMLGYGSLDAYPDIVHFVTTRVGGCSRGSYASFNCSPYSGDDPHCVRRNQELLLQGLRQRPVELVIPQQTHGSACLVVDEAYAFAASHQHISQEALATQQLGNKQKGLSSNLPFCNQMDGVDGLTSNRPLTKQLLLEGVDALTTNLPGYCLCISTADCIPLLLYDKAHQAVAAIHAGWRGTVQRIVEHTLQQMAAQYGTQGEDVVACIGPGISQASFEVGEEVADTFRHQGFPMERIAIRHPRTGRPHIDLWEANRLQLLACGVPSSQIETAGICTYREHQTFFSARRLGIASGRLLSGIMIAQPI